MQITTRYEKYKFLNPLFTIRNLVLVGIFACFVPIVIAQDEADDVYDLDPFTVSENDVFGYGTIRASSASSIAIPITDIAGLVVTISGPFWSRLRKLDHMKS